MGKLAGTAITFVLLLVSLLLVPVLSVSGHGTVSPAFAAAPCRVSGEFDTEQVPGEWGTEVVKAAKVAGIPAGILAAQLEAESGWDPRAVSPVGAQGLAQFMPGTWKTFGDGGNPLDPTAAIAAQGRYMGHLVEELDDVAEDTGTPIIDLVLAGYNAGPGAVRKHAGIPPYQETQRYVDRITRSAAADYGAACTETSGETEDIYPYPNGPYCPLDGSGCMPGAVNPDTGMYKRECVDWVIYKINSDLGDTKAPFEWTNQTLLGGNGNAVYWKSEWEARGWPVSSTPKVGAVAWFAPGAAGAGPLGHVATVAAVNDDGTVLIEEYNGQAPPNDHQYGTRTLPAGDVSAYLYMPDAA